MGHVVATSYFSFSRGIAILISKKLTFRSLDSVKDSQGRYVIVKGILAGKESPHPSKLLIIWGGALD